MKVSIISVVAGGAALAGALAISACSTLEVDSAGSPPVPRTQPGSHTEIAYVLQKGKWHQLRIDMVAKGPRLNSDGDAYHLHLRSVASVWQFNRRTGDYDIRLSPHESPSAEQGMRFSFYRGPTVDRLQMSPGNGGGGGGAAGWPEHNFTEIELKVDPTPGANGVVTEDEMEFRAIGTVVVKPVKRDRRAGVLPLRLSVERRWRAEVLPGRKARFTELVD
ncbi:MAG: hypothetical protein ACI8XO_001268 [Verrucomicrobiales bacterium]|jgi:hypothetical protein